MANKRYVLYNDQLDKDEDSRYSLYKRPFNPCKPFDGTVTVYNTLTYKSQDKRIFDRNHFFDNGFGFFIEFYNINLPFDTTQKVRFNAKNYNVLSDAAIGQSPATHPAKYALFGPNDLPVTKQGVIPHYDQGIVLAPDQTVAAPWIEPDLVGRGTGFSTPDQTFQEVATFANHHTKHSIILNNQRETAIFDDVAGTPGVAYTDGNNASDQTFDQVDELKLPPFSYVFYDESKDPVEMKYILLHTVVAPCRSGHLYLELDNPNITEAIDSTDLSGNDHMVYFFGWQGNPDVNELTGEQFEANILNQLKQNPQDDINDKIWAANEDLFITAPDDFSGSEDYEGNIKLLYCCRLSDIKSIPDTKKMVVGLNLESKDGDLTFVNILIGMKAIDWKFATRTKSSATGIDNSEEIYGTYTNPSVMSKITFTCDDMRILLDEEGEIPWDDRPLHPITADSLRSSSGIDEENFGFDDVFFTNRYGLFAVDSDGIITVVGDEAKFGFPDEVEDLFVTANSSKLIVVTSRDDIFKGFANRTPSRELNFGNTGLVGDFSVCGNNMSVGSYQLKEAKEGQYVLRLPQIFRLNKVNTSFTAPGAFISNADLTGHIITLQRGDEFIRKGSQTFNSNGRIDMETLRTSMTKLKEWTTETFYSNPKTAESGDSNVIYQEPNKCDMHRYIDIDITEGQGIQVSGKFWLCSGKSGAGTDKAGFFEPDKAQGTTGSAGAFNVFFVKAYCRILAKLEGSTFGDTSFPYRVDLGCMLFNTPRTFNLLELATPRLKLGL